MINIPAKITKPLSKDTLASLNNKISEPISKDTVLSLNTKQRSRPAVNPQGVSGQQPVSRPVAASSASGANRANQNGTISHNRQEPPRTVSQPQVPVQTSNMLPDMIVPNLINSLRKGQKTSLDPQNRGLQSLKACFGWNIKDARCDMDASAFLITNTGKVPGDEWFVFYGQTESPDNSVQFGTDPSHKDREVISVNLQRLNRSIQKIVFVLTINEAFENNLNFSMIKDAYIRILNGSTNQEIVSYKLEEYYSNVTSMTIGELYIHNGQWKFNPVGNGVHQDLAGQCAIYGVEIA